MLLFTCLLVFKQVRVIVLQESQVTIELAVAKVLLGQPEQSLEKLGLSGVGTSPAPR